MDFIKRLIKLAMEYQDTLDEETPPPLDPALAADAGKQVLNLRPGQEPQTAGEITSDSEGRRLTIGSAAFELDSKETCSPVAAEDQPAETEPEAPVEPAMFQSNRQAALKGECVTDTFLTIPPRRPSFFDKN